MSLAYEYLSNGSMITASATQYTESMGYWWVLILLIFTIACVQMITKEYGATSSVGLIGSAFLLYHTPSYVPVESHPIIYLILVISTAMLLYRFMGKGE